MEPILHDPKVKALIEELHLRELRKFLATLDTANIPSLVMKGTALAYSHYSEPSLRERFDSDIWIREKDISRARAALIDQGFEIENTNFDVHRQMVITIRDRRNICHVFDLHWSPLIPVLLRNVLKFSDSYSRSVSLTQVGPKARRLDDADSVLLACAHWVGHHYSAPHPLWLRDLELLTQHKTEQWWKDLEEQFVEAGIAKIGAATLKMVRDSGAVQIPINIIENLQIAQTYEPTEYFLKDNRNKFTDALSDLKALSTFSERLQLIKDHLFPNNEYLVAKYGVSGRLRIFVLGIRRLVFGIAKLTEKARP